MMRRQAFLHATLVLWTEAAIPTHRPAMNLHPAIVALAVLLFPLSAGAAEVQPGTALFFGIHWIDTSTEGAINGIRDDETARVEMIEDQIAADLAERGFALTLPEETEVAAIKNPTHCNGCDTKMAAAKGLDYAISGEVQKVSNLILSMNLHIRDADSGRTVAAGAVDIRGNNDESWQRGFRYLLKNVIFRQERAP